MRFPFYDESQALLLVFEKYKFNQLGCGQEDKGGFRASAAANLTSFLWVHQKSHTHTQTPGRQARIKWDELSARASLRSNYELSKFSFCLPPSLSVIIV